MLVVLRCPARYKANKSMFSFQAAYFLNPDSTPYTNHALVALSLSKNTLSLSFLPSHLYVQTHMRRLSNTCSHVREHACTALTYKKCEHKAGLLFLESSPRKTDRVRSDLRFPGEAWPPGRQLDTGKVLMKEALVILSERA